MTTAIGVVITEHIVTGRLENQEITGKLLRYPDDPDTMDALSAIPDTELVDVLAEHILSIAGTAAGTASAIGVRLLR